MLLPIATPHFTAKPELLPTVGEAYKIYQINTAKNITIITKTGETYTPENDLHISLEQELSNLKLIAWYNLNAPYKIGTKFTQKTRTAILTHIIESFNPTTGKPIIATFNTRKEYTTEEIKEKLTKKYWLIKNY